MKKIVYIIFLIFIISNSSYAVKDESANNLPQKGVLLSSFNNTKNVKMYDTWGGDSLDGPTSAPISARMTKNSKTLWGLTATNNSKSKYTFTLEFLQFSDDGKQIKKNIFPFSLMPNDSKTVKISPSDRGEDYMVNIISWKKYELKKETKKTRDSNDTIKDKDTKSVKSKKNVKSKSKKSKAKKIKIKFL